MEQKQKAIVLLVVGTLLIASIQMFNYLMQISDGLMGLGLGTGLGLLGISIFKLRKLRKLEKQ